MNFLEQETGYKNKISELEGTIFALKIMPKIDKLLLNTIKQGDDFIDTSISTQLVLDNELKALETVLTERGYDFIRLERGRVKGDHYGLGYNAMRRLYISFSFKKAVENILL